MLKVYYKIIVKLNLRVCLITFFFSKYLNGNVFSKRVFEKITYKELV